MKSSYITLFWYRKCYLRIWCMFITCIDVQRRGKSIYTRSVWRCFWDCNREDEMVIRDAHNASPYTIGSHGSWTKITVLLQYLIVECVVYEWLVKVALKRRTTVLAYERAEWEAGGRNFNLKIRFDSRWKWHEGAELRLIYLFYGAVEIAMLSSWAKCL